MPLQLPNLDDRTYEDLVEEALRLIPTYDPEWTNHNPSDPGIALIELFAYLSEILIYRLNRVTDDNLRTFLKLLNGPDWVQTREQLREEVRLAVLGIRDRYRAVTCEDFEYLSTTSFNNWLAQMQQTEKEAKSLEEWWKVTKLEQNPDHLPSKVNLIQRTRCVPQRYLEAGDEIARRQPAPNCISMVILPSNPSVAVQELGPQPTSIQRRVLWGYLDERRLLTTRHYVVGPSYAPVSAEIVVARRSDVPTENLRTQIIKTIQDFLYPLPLKDVPDHQEWFLGRDIYVSELYELLEKLNGVDYVSDIVLFSECQPQEQHCVAAESIWNNEGELMGLRLYDHHLPAARLDPNQIEIAPNVNFLLVQLNISVVKGSGAEPNILKQQIKSRMRDFFHPLHGGPGPTTPGDTTIRLQDIQQAVAAIAGEQQIESIRLQSDLTRLLHDNNQIIGVVVKAGEVIDLRLQVEVKEAAS